MVSTSQMSDCCSTFPSARLDRTARKVKPFSALEAHTAVVERTSRYAQQARFNRELVSLTACRRLLASLHLKLDQ
tara:strand:- start:1064 stop:1288 length:225 start_codon:yes stop_codon:yes gene_type:complete